MPLLLGVLILLAAATPCSVFGQGDPWFASDPEIFQDWYNKLGVANEIYSGTRFLAPVLRLTPQQGNLPDATQTANDYDVGDMIRVENLPGHTNYDDNDIGWNYWVLADDGTWKQLFFDLYELVDGIDGSDGGSGQVTTVVVNDLLQQVIWFPRTAPLFDYYPGSALPEGDQIQWAWGQWESFDLNPVQFEYLKEEGNPFRNIGVRLYHPGLWMLAEQPMHLTLALGPYTTGVDITYRGGVVGQLNRKAKTDTRMRRRTFR